jgi:multicomponent Na+:H+ antiporter subunit B
MAYAGFGLFIATLSGLASALAGRNFMTGLWTSPTVLGTQVDLSTPMVFDIGVYFVVAGAMTSIILALEDREGGF